MEPISLGSNMQDHLVAEGKIDEPSPMGMGGKGTKFPEFHYAGREDLDLPDSGEITFRFKKTQEKRLVVNGVHYYECCADLVKITDKPEEGSTTAPAKSYDEAGDALDKIRKDMEGEHEEDEDEENPGNPGY